MKESKTNVATETSNVLSALDKVEERKRKLQLEIETSDDVVEISKNRKFIAKLDEKADKLFEALWEETEND